MDNLNKIIYQGYDIALTDKDVIEIVYHWKRLNDFVVKSRYIRTIIECFDNGIIDTNSFLLNAITVYDSPEDLILIALPLRYGVEYKYTTYKDIGNVHIMVFTVMELMNHTRVVKNANAKPSEPPKIEHISNFEIENILCIMSLLGISTAARAYTITERNEITVAEYLNQNGFYNFLNPMEYLNMITDPEFNNRVAIGAMCDLPEVAFPIGPDKTIVTEYYDESGFLATEKSVLVPQPTITEMILYNSFECAMNASIPATFSTGELAQIKMCIDTGALEIFKILIDRGFNFSYFSMNRLLVALKNTNVEKKGNNKIFYLIYTEMLKYVIVRGVTMDRFQFNYLNNFSTEYAKEISEIYSTPLWQKACSGADNIPLPAMVNALAASLNIDATKDKPEVCSDLRQLASMDHMLLSELEKFKQVEQLRLTQPVTARLNKKAPVFCKNAADIDPLKYTDNTLVFYTDKNNDSWCFTATDFDELVKNPVNPITKEILPAKVVGHMNDKIGMYKILGVNPASLKTYEESLKDLYKQDTISNIKTGHIINYVLNMASNRGIYEPRLRSIPYGKLIYILGEIKMSQDYISELPNDFQFAIFCKIIYNYLQKNNKKVDYIFEIIKY